MKINTRHLNALVAAIAAAVILPSIPLRAQDNPRAPDQAPRALAQPSPSYSYDLRHDAIAGEVVVSFTVTPTGEVTNAAVVSSTHKRLEKPVLEAVKKWKFAPAVKAGAPVSSKVIQPVAFAISG
jgi:protein TonB